MSVDEVVRWFHLLAAAVWIGGTITVASIVPVLRRAGTPIEQVRAVARRFGVVAWSALTVSVTTGIVQLDRLDVNLKGNTALAIKLTLVGLAAALAWIHQMVAKSSSAAVRGMMEGLLLLIGLAILAAAVAI